MVLAACFLFALRLPTVTHQKKSLCERNAKAVSLEMQDWMERFCSVVDSTADKLQRKYFVCIILICKLLCIKVSHKCNM